MPSASTSIFRMPSASRSSLSHSMVVRFSIAALAMGTTSSSRERVMTKPPVCWDRWRGKPANSRDRSSASASLCSPGSKPILRNSFRSTAPDHQPAMVAERAAISLSLKPKTLATSRVEERAR